MGMVKSMSCCKQAANHLHSLLPFTRFDSRMGVRFIVSFWQLSDLYTMMSSELKHVEYVKIMPPPLFCSIKANFGVNLFEVQRNPGGIFWFSLFV